MPFADARPIPQPDEVWTHFRGGRYNIIGVAKHANTGERLVIYEPLEPGNYWCRPLDEFMGTVWVDEDTSGYRFRRLT